MKLGKYAECLNVWEHKLGKVVHKLNPKKADNLALANIIHFQKEKTLGWTLEEIGKLYMSMVLKAYPNMNEEDKKELDEAIGVNYNQIFKDIMIAFRWTTKEAIEAAEVKQMDELKKNIKS